MTTAAISTYRAILCSLLAVWIATGSRCRVGPDHAFGKDYKTSKQTEESRQKQKHDHGLKHFAPLRLQIATLISGCACPGLIHVKSANKRRMRSVAQSYKQGIEFAFCRRSSVSTRPLKAGHSPPARFALFSFNVFDNRSLWTFRTRRERFGLSIF